MKWCYPGAAIVALLALAALSCKHVDEKGASETEGLSMPDSKGIGLTFISPIPQQLLGGVVDNLPLLAQAANPGGAGSEMKQIAQKIRCESPRGGEMRCRLTYSGPELKLKLSQLLFNTMAGAVWLRRGCQDAKCAQPPAKVWWRTVARDTGNERREYDVEVCRIDGLEAGVGGSERFNFIGKVLDKVGYKPHVNGFKVTVEPYEREVPALTEEGAPKTDPNGKAMVEKITDYRAKSAFGGLGPVGPFPNKDCALSDDADGDRLKTSPSQEQAGLGRVPGVLLSQVPGALVKVASDMIAFLGHESSGKDLNIDLQCQNIPGKPVCHMVYRGPEVYVPIPRAITGMPDTELRILRRCRNPGCTQRNEAKVTLTTYRQGEDSIVEACSLSGMELSPRIKFPGQERIVGVPDLKGQIATLGPPSGEGLNRTFELKSFRLGINKFGNYPTKNCEFQR